MSSGCAIYHDLLIRRRLHVVWTGGPVVEFRLLHTVVVGSISSGGMKQKQYSHYIPSHKSSKRQARDAVTYWPSTEPSIKRCTCVNKQRNSGNSCIWLKISEYHLDLWTWLNSVQMHTPNDITRCHRQLGSVGVRVAIPVGDKMLEWEPAPDRGLGPTGPTVEQPSRMRKKCCYGQRNLGSICGSLSPSPTHLSHITNINSFATLSRTKCERYMIIKKCSFVHLNSSLCFCLHLHVYEYTTMLDTAG